MRTLAAAVLATLFVCNAAVAAEAAPTKADPAKVEFQWGARIPLRDGVELAATVYKPRDGGAAVPCVFTLTPYTAQNYHDRGMYFASHGYVFLTVDVRGRGNSAGEFDPMLQEAKDGHDVVEWLAKQPYCNGKVAMWGGSYAGYDQWVAGANNATFGAQAAYDGLVPEFEALFEREGGNWPAFYDAVKRLAVLPAAQRTQVLRQARTTKQTETHGG